MSESVALIVVATGLYSRFLPELVATARTHVRGLDRVFVLSDVEPAASDIVHWLPWGHLRWPLPTMMRYRAILAYRDVLLEHGGVLVYVDVDMRFAGEVDLRDVTGLIAVQHPGYVDSNPNDYPYERRPASTSAIPPGDGEQYYAGGVQGGDTAAYLDACRVLADWLHADLSRGLVPVWHDESAWNKFCYLHPPNRVLTPDYCSPEHEHNPAAHIVALDKDHNRVRQVAWREVAAQRALRYLRQLGRIKRAPARLRRVLTRTSDRPTQ
jgi:histo-blood group ABO system transferase